MSTLIDLLAITQEEAVMRVISQRMGINYELINPKYFTFTYNQVNDAQVSVQIKARAQATDGTLSPWAQERTVTFYRAELRGLASQRIMTVNFVNGMAMEHILRALKLLHSFNVSISELEFLNAQGQWVQLAESYRPNVASMQVRFAQSQARFKPSTSQFQINLDQTVRNDIGEYLRLIAAGTIAGVLT